MKVPLALLLLVALAPPVRPQAVEAAGTYSVLLCRSACAPADSAQALARGVLVLDSTRLAGDAWGMRINGCFEFQRSQLLRSYAVLFPRGYTSWSQSGDSLEFLTYRSPDAGHEVRALLSASGFVGVGHSWGAGVAAISEPDEFVIGVRIGPADLAHCSFVAADRRTRWLAPLVFGVAMVVGALFAIR